MRVGYDLRPMLVSRACEFVPASCAWLARTSAASRSHTCMGKLRPTHSAHLTCKRARSVSITFVFGFCTSRTQSCGSVHARGPATRASAAAAAAAAAAVTAPRARCAAPRSTTAVAGALTAACAAAASEVTAAAVAAAAALAAAAAASVACLSQHTFKSNKQKIEMYLAHTPEVGCVQLLHQPLHRSAPRHVVPDVRSHANNVERRRGVARCVYVERHREPRLVVLVRRRRREPSCRVVVQVAHASVRTPDAGLVVPEYAVCQHARSTSHSNAHVVNTKYQIYV